MVTIQTLSHDGRGIATIDGKTTFIAGALPGEKVTYKITRKHARYNEAIALEIIEPSIDRVKPDCAHFGICGGCSLQHLAVPAQIQLKQTTLLEQLQHFGKVQPDTVLPPLTAHASGYRRKARLGAKFVVKKDKLLVGFREKCGRYLADIQQCTVLYPQVGKIIDAIAAMIRTLEQYQHIPQIEIAAGDNATALVFRHMTPLSEHDIQILIEFCKIHQFHLYLQPNRPERIHKVWPEDITDERLSYNLNDYQIEMRFHPLDFTQVNFELNNLMLKQALQLLDPQPHENILDLFCGIGNFTLPIARFARSVTGIEGSQEMVERATENAQHNQLSNVEFYAANLQVEVITGSWTQRVYEKILLDPPRTGAKEIIPMIGKLAPARIVYISCNPATLARDAGELVTHHHYRFTHAGVMNMFPHTSHIEAIAVFEK